MSDPAQTWRGRFSSSIEMPDEFACTIHYFAHNPTTSHTSQSRLFAHGRELLFQVKGDAIPWHSRRPSWLWKKNKKAVFEYALKPPRMKGARVDVLKDWGAPLEGSEIFRTAKLPEFLSTDFIAPSAASKMRCGSPLPESVPTKKRKFDRESLYQLIPQPHFFPSPTRVSSKQTEFRAFKKTSPIFIPPHLSLPIFLDWDRCTWIVPVCGSLPWPESTSATLKDESLGDPAGPSSDVNEITWTPEAVLQLWRFLLDLRTAGQLGPLSLSYQPASPGITDSIQASTTLLTDSHMQTHTSISLSLSISATDHIRIYHDGLKCLGLRTVLDAWKFQNGGRGVRLLVGAKLVLLDEKSRGIMIL